MSSIFLQAKVIRTRSTESMPFPFSFMMVVVSFLWLCYGTAVNDRNIQVTRHSLTPDTQGSQLGRNISGWNTSLQVYKESGKYICYPILCYVGLCSISRCQTPFWILIVAGNYLYASLRGWAPPNVSPNLHKWACSQAVSKLTIMENGCTQGAGLHFSTWRWHPHQRKVSTLPVPTL